ncbi:MAG: DUF1294 domain-containing protein [Lachnospiraceae bacterium]|nr:DUF1294 domain-containing protein [Lachnospiraceae bacterium]
MQIALWIYLAVINLAAFIMFAVDKIKAIKGKWRIRESTLLIISFIGGSLGGLLGMIICRHKIRKWYFAAGIPLMLILHIAGIVLLYVKVF